MDGLKLLHEQTRPQNSGEWIDDKGVRAALFVYGELAWVARMPAGRNLRGPDVEQPKRGVRSNHLAGPDPVASEPRPRRPASSAGGHAPSHPKSPPPRSLCRMPARWLKNAADLQRLLHRLGPDGARDYLKTHLPSIAAMGAGFTNQERQDLLAYILRLRRRQYRAHAGRAMDSA